MPSLPDHLLLVVFPLSLVKRPRVEFKCRKIGLDNEMLSCYNVWDMSNNTPEEGIVSDWAVLGVMAHRLRREILRLCWSRSYSVAELGELLKINPGTALYHVRRLRGVNLIRIESTEKKRGVIEKRYRSTMKTVNFQPPVEEATAEALAPALSVVGKSLRTISPALALQRRAPLVVHVAEARIGQAEQRIVAQRLAELARYLENLPEDSEGVPMVLAAAFGPQSEL